MNTFELPTWAECSQKDPNERNPLEVFISENEPACIDLEKSWRGELLDAIQFVLDNQK